MTKLFIINYLFGEMLEEGIWGWIKRNYEKNLGVYKNDHQGC